MAVGADLHFQRLFHGTGFEFVTACTCNSYYVVLRMNTLFHLIYTSFRPESFAETELYQHISDSSTLTAEMQQVDRLGHVFPAPKLFWWHVGK